MRKWIIALMCIALLMGLCACSQPAQQAGGSSNETPGTPAVFGMLTLNMNAIVNVSYDSEGFVLSVSSGNEMGDEVIGKLTTTKGLSCTKLMCELVTAAADTSYASDHNIILLKQAAGSQVPSENFLETIRLEVEKIAGDRSIILVTVDQLIEDGHLSLDSAKELLMKQLKVEADTISGDPVMQDSRYWLSVTQNDAVINYTLDANLGVIEELPAEPVMEPLPEGPDEGYYDPTMDMVGVTTEFYDPFLDEQQNYYTGEEDTEATTEGTTEATTEATTDTTEAV